VIQEEKQVGGEEGIFHYINFLLLGY